MAQTKQLVKILTWLQCSVGLVDEAAKQRLRVKEESYKAYIEEELSHRKRRNEIHQAGIGDLAHTKVRE